MTIEILIYDGVDELDVVGPFEVLSALAPRLVTLEPVPTVRSSHGLVLTPDGTLSDAPGVLVVPGGGWVARDPGASCYGEYLRGAMPEAIAARHARGTVVAGVCTGGMLLAKAGILDGRPAVTHRAALDEMGGHGVNLRPGARWVDDGDVLTAGGVTSGIDLALHLLERLSGPEAARAEERRLEHQRLDAAVAQEPAAS